MNISNYSQPDFYKFNSDSIELINYALEELCDLTDISVLDICSGCGIIGIEFSFHHKSVRNLTLIELQNDYKSHILKNIERLNIKTDIYFNDFKEVDLSKKYEVILCNPPYFKPSSGRKSPDHRRQLSRTYEARDLEHLLAFSIDSLKENGEIIIVHREDLTTIDNRFSMVKELNGAKLFRFILNEN
jgi:tRNA1(Val) A37 N6-methylase TrmN6